MSIASQELGACQDHRGSAYIPLAYDPVESASSASRLIDALLPEWNLAPGEVQYVKLTQGINNVLFKVSKMTPGKLEESNDEESIVIRAYGKGTEILIDRERELFFHNVLAQHGLASPVLAQFRNGFLYRFIAGTPCSPDDLLRPKIWRGVACEMAKWHAVLLVGSPQQAPGVSNGRDQDAFSQRPTSPESKRAEAFRVTHNVARAKPTPNIWSTMQNWIMLLPTGTKEQRSKREILEKELEHLAEDYSEVGTTGQNGYVLAHCDLLCGNIIVKPRRQYAGTTDKDVAVVRFIDFEYASFAPAAFDIVSHFAEWAGFECDYSRLPTRSVRRAFLHEYVGAFIDRLGHLKKTLPLHPVPLVEKLMEEVDLLRALPSFFWGICSLVQATISDSFEHSTYAALRLQEYWDWRAEVDGTRVRTGRTMPAREARWLQEM